MATKRKTAKYLPQKWAEVGRVGVAALTTVLFHVLWLKGTPFKLAVFIWACNWQSVCHRPKRKCAKGSLMNSGGKLKY